MTGLAWDHVHLVSQNAEAAARWYCEMLGGQIIRVQQALRGAPQIDVRLGGRTIVIRGVRPGETPGVPSLLRHFEGYASHERLGLDHFGLTFDGDLRAFCDELKAKGVNIPVEPWEFTPGVVLCYLTGPDGVSIEIIQTA